MSTGQRVVVSGGTGLIGEALVRRLSAAGREVVVLSRRAAAAGDLPPGVRVLPWNGRDAAGWGEVVDGAAALVNLAGEPIAGGRWTAARKQRIVASRQQACAALLAAVRAARTRPEVLLQASAVGFYGDRAEEILDEESAPGSGFLAETTVAWERASAPFEALAVRRVLVRTGIVLARDGGALPRILLPLRFGVGGALGSGRQWMPWIHLEDEVAALLWLLERRDLAGPFNLTAPHPATNAELTREAARRLGRPAVLRVPEWALRSILGELAEAVLGSQRALPRRLLASGFRFRYPELAPALDALLARPA